MGKLNRAASIDDLRLQARRHLPRTIFEFIDGGAGGERTLRANRSDLERLTLKPRVAVNVAERRAVVELAGQAAALPLVLGPTGLAGVYWPQGEVAAARAAAAAGIPFCLSTNSVASMEEVAKGAPGGDLWFQLYFLKDEALMDALLERARNSGYRVLCLTLDLAVQGRRDRDIRNAFTIPFRPTLKTVFETAIRPAWFAGFLQSGGVRFGNFEGSLPKQGFMSIAAHIAALCDAGADWDTVARVAAKWDGPVVIKGILSPEDAERAVALGPEAIIVSNHGGRQLDHVPSAAAALPDIVAAVGGRTQVILDGGVYRGTDLIKARAMGAGACMVGRGFLWGLAAGGQAGVARAIDIYREELDIGMALLGQPDFDGIGRDALLTGPEGYPS